MKNMESISQNPLVKTFRFDDVSPNTDMILLGEITRYIISKFPGAKLIYCISPLCHDMAGGRVFPQVFNALADYRKHYSVNRAGVPDLMPCVRGLTAGHGLIHVNHQLLDYQAQEMSILASCSLAYDARIFLPPWNKWNEITEMICEENGIELIKFEDGWRSLEHSGFDPKHHLWYMHPYAWTLDKIKKWFGDEAS